MPLFNKVAIVGTGLIGGSIALDLKKKGLCKIIAGVSRHQESLKFAKKTGAIDIGSQSLCVIKDSDLVILAAPVSAIKEKARRIAEIISKDCIVFDVASTKEEIVSLLDPLFPRFVGAHPIAGSERKGIKNARPGLFKDSICILTSTKRTDALALNKIKKLWLELGAKVVLMKPQAHDRILAFVSHMPHVAAFALINSVPSDCLGLAPNSLKDTTRVASSDSGLWSDIILSNKKNVITAVKVLENKISDIKKSLLRNDRKHLIKILNQAKARRDLLNASNPT